MHKQPYSDMPDHVETILMKLTREELRLSYNAVCNAYLAAFCEKHGSDIVVLALNTDSQNCSSEPLL